MKFNEMSLRVPSQSFITNTQIMNNLINLSKYNILLASKSPRRRELLSSLRIPFHCISIGGIDESYPEDMPRTEIPQFLANKKADAYIEEMQEKDMVITADTLVIKGDKVYGKPHNAQEAFEMLHELSGCVHKVVTGVCILTSDQRTSFTAETEVKFTELSDEDINYYIDNFMPFDKAGAYGIQEWIGCVAVEWINGSYYNVMGLPVHRLYKELKHF